jgi:hypothetical protein
MRAMINRRVPFVVPLSRRHREQLEKKLAHRRLVRSIASATLVAVGVALWWWARSW